MARYIAGRIDWDRFRTDLRRYQRQQDLNNAQLARQLHVSAAALTRYHTGERLPSSEVFAFSLLLMGRELRDYVVGWPGATA
ncbi:hypothetical protein GCM10010840_33810 [Deinococcus aerolatus]|uniref:Helix-turn-helix n=1 Tax=Deinococcus aerolatus TaxID=522487 RepID=A0ABQ2GFT2_9DEIO|nr:helix-turn-helix domain-containing protein [Deinococcus aerolatus]GGL92964.1 hypothetical protein GCM10010840_33810 [Deinococcus aerolatus]